MDYYYKEFSKLQEEFHDVIHNYPLFKEDIDEIDEKKIKEINELLDKNDEYYLKKAIDKLKDLIKYIKDTNQSINEEYSKFDKLVGIWEKVNFTNIDEKTLSKINDEVNRANELIKSHKLEDLSEANIIMERLIKMAR